MKFKDYFRKLKEAELDFGDEAQADTIDQAKKNAISDEPYSQQRGFISPDGSIIKIGSLSHYEKATSQGYEGIEQYCFNDGVIRWSPETNSFSVCKKMTNNQIDTIRSIIAEYGYEDITIEYVNKLGHFSGVSFYGDPREFEPKIKKVQSQVYSKDPISEAEFDFGDDAQKDSIANVAAEVNPKYNKIPPIHAKNKQKWKEARGFIKLSGAIERIGDMAHEAFAQDLGYPVMIDGTLVQKKFSNSKFMCIATGLIRWSPETSAFSVYRTMTPEQIKTIKEIIKSYGYNNLWIEYMNKEGQMDMVAFDEGDPSLFNAKIAGIQHRVNDKKLGQR